MIVGVVNADSEATLRLKIFGIAGQSIEIETVIDTGFTGQLTLSSADIQVLGLPYAGRQLATLADGSTLLLDMHSAIVEWDGQSRRIEVDAAETTALLGMGLLYGHNISMQVIDGGSVHIERL